MHSQRERIHLLWVSGDHFAGVWSEIYKKLKRTSSEDSSNYLFVCDEDLCFE